MAFLVDLTNDTKDTIDRTMPEPGWYLVHCTDSFPDPELDAQVMRYSVLGPTYKNANIDDRIFNPESSESDDKAAVSWRRVKVLASRMGLIGDGDFGKQVELDWRKAIGKQFCLHLTERAYKKDGVDKTAVNVDFAGVYPLDHDKIPAHERVRMGLKLLPGQENAPPAGTNGEPDAGTAKKTRGRKAAPAATASAKPAINVDDV